MFAGADSDTLVYRDGHRVRFLDEGVDERGSRLVLEHVWVQPAMFELWHRLDRQGKTLGPGIPKNPLWLGVLWERQDGYIAGLPPAAQRLVLGGLARLARAVGYPTA